MAIFKCKACGAPLEIKPGVTVVECDHCEVSNTLPKLENDKKANLIDRANHFRRSNEFDKASALYEEILNEDPTDAEIYWSLVLCRYGVEYVEDPASHKRMPTVNRAQFTAIYDDDNYKQALQYADEEQKVVYEKESRAINEIQKQILTISKSEEPFDVFICYKQSDENGERTRDSVIANDLYYQLTQEGFKVFYAAITLEDKLGTAYEPYIFAALNSAKVMVVVATKPEYVNAVWVKNEWSRYLSLIKSGAKKTLIPAYRDMDPYDLPEEFSHLQAQDMTKLGFMQDLTRGIKKILEADKPKEAAPKTVFMSSSAESVPQNEALLKRAFMFLEDGDWKNANAYCEKVLDTDPENAYAYLGKLMADLSVRNEDELCLQAIDFTQDPLLLKALRFADNNLKERLTKIAGNCKKNYIYNTAIRYMNVGSIPQLPNSSEVEEEGNKQIAQYEQAIQIFEQIKGFKDSNAQIEICHEKMRYIKSKIEEAKVTELADIEYRRRVEKAEQKRQKKKKLILTGSIILFVVLAIIVIFVNKSVIEPSNAYKEALSLRNKGDYLSALEIYYILNDYKDSEVQADECLIEMEAQLTALLEEQRYDEGFEFVTNVYSLMEEQDQETAEEKTKPFTDILYNSLTSLQNVDILPMIYSKLGDYDYKARDFWDKEEERHYSFWLQKGITLQSENDFLKAVTIFDTLGEFKNSKELSLQIKKNKEYQLIAPVGYEIAIGQYEQDHNLSNGSEDIEWVILEKLDSKVFVVSKYALEYLNYDGYHSTTWETSTLREWLNKTFFTSAFSSTEQSKILLSAVSADRNPDSNKHPGNATNDNIFLLSVPELNKYFSSAEDKACIASIYTYNKGAYTNNRDATYYWLRSPGKETDPTAGGQTTNNVAVVSSDGEISQKDCWDECGVRPAMWIDLDN